MIGVPFAKAVNPVTKTNWKGTGVEPDVKTPAADALTTAGEAGQQKKFTPGGPSNHNGLRSMPLLIA